jgi:hypothetical protein
MLVAEVPPGVVTVTSTVPVPAGAVAVIELSELNTNDVAAVDPNLTDVAPVKPLPRMLTTVPPVLGPEVGEIPETVVAYVKLSAAVVAEVPARVVTVMSTLPAEAAGDTAVIDDALTTVYEVAAVIPNFTPLAPVNPVPVIVTVVPPAGPPLVGAIPVTVGA